MFEADNKLYLLELSQSFRYNTLKAAYHNNIGMYFKVIDGEPVLIVSRPHSSRGEREREEILDNIHWDEWWKYKLAEQKSTIDRLEIKDEDFTPCKKTFTEILAKEMKSDKWACDVQVLGVAVSEKRHLTFEEICALD